MRLYLSWDSLSSLTYLLHDILHWANSPWGERTHRGFNMPHDLVNHVAQLGIHPTRIIPVNTRDQLRALTCDRLTLFKAISTQLGGRNAMLPMIMAVPKVIIPRNNAMPP